MQIASFKRPVSMIYQELPLLNFSELSVQTALGSMKPVLVEQLCCVSSNKQIVLVCLL